MSSWLQDDWLLDTGRGSRPRPALVPFFPEVHEELMKSWMAPFSTLDGGAARVYVDIPQVESAVAVNLCLQNATIWKNCPRLPSKASKLTAALAAKAYSAAGQATSALHAMAILRVHQAKALKCTRVVPTRGWSRNCARRLTSPYGRRKTQRSPSGRRCPHLWSRAPSMAQPCGEERYRQSALSRCSLLPGWTVRRHCRGLCPAVLGSTEADRGYPTHLAPAWCTICQRSAAGQAPVCLSPWAPSCVLQSCSAPCWIVT